MDNHSIPNDALILFDETRNSPSRQDEAEIASEAKESMLPNQVVSLTSQLGPLNRNNLHFPWPKGMVLSSQIFMHIRNHRIKHAFEPNNINAKVQLLPFQSIQSSLLVKCHHRDAIYRMNILPVYRAMYENYLLSKQIIASSPKIEILEDEENKQSFKPSISLHISNKKPQKMSFQAQQSIFELMSSYTFSRTNYTGTQLNLVSHVFRNAEITQKKLKLVNELKTTMLNNCDHETIMTTVEKFRKRNMAIELSKPKTCFNFFKSRLDNTFKEIEKVLESDKKISALK